MRETVQGVKRVGPRRSNGVGFGGGRGGCFWCGDRRETGPAGGAVAPLPSLSYSTLVGLCDRLGGGQTRWVSEGSRAPVRLLDAPLAVRPLGRDLYLAHHSELPEQRSSCRVPPDPS